VCGICYELVSRRCVMYVGDWTFCSMRSRYWRLEVVLYVLEMLEGMHRMPLCMLKAVEGELCLLEGAGGVGDDLLCAALYSRGCRGSALFVGGAGVVGGDALCATRYAGG